MRRKFIALFLTLAMAGGAGAQTETTPDPKQLLDRGISSYRAGNYETAATDLSAASQAFLSSEQMQAYVNSGRFDDLGALETALVYLTLAHSKRGRTAEAREAVIRLIAAERIQPTYAALPLEADAAEFEVVSRQLLSDVALPPNAQLARGGAIVPPTAVAQVEPPTMTPSETRPAPIVTRTTPPAVTLAQAPPPTPPAPIPPPPCAETAVVAAVERPAAPTAEQELERQRYIEQRLNQERERLQRIADERVVAERAAGQKSAKEQVAAAERSADQRVAAVQRAAEEMIAQARRSADERVAAARARTGSEYLASLRVAGTHAAEGRVGEANGIYLILATSVEIPRDMLSEAAVGLYRTGAYPAAVAAFDRLGAFSHGEEDLRFYNAVSLYETGKYADARKELSCALPFLELTESVTRYRSKIERTSGQAAVR